MQITDVIADMLTRIRNANSSKHETVDIPASGVKKAIAEILQEEGYINGYQVIEDGKQGVICNVKVRSKQDQSNTGSSQSIKART